MLKKLVIVPIVAIIIVLAGCEAPKDNSAAIESAMSEAKNAMKVANDAVGAATAANKTAQRAEAMTEQNRSALRALNDKIDRMFRTISRK